jgi:heme-degrading monooxygenase HmoA
MFLIREVLHCKPGKVGELIEKFKTVGKVMQSMGIQPFRLFTDMSGERFWTLVLESEFETLDAYEEMESRILANEEVRQAMAGYHDLVENGRREIYRVVE